MTCDHRQSLCIAFGERGEYSRLLCGKESPPVHGQGKGSHCPGEITQ